MEDGCLFSVLHHSFFSSLKRPIDLMNVAVQLDCTHRQYSFKYSYIPSLPSFSFSLLKLGHDEALLLQ